MKPRVDRRALIAGGVAAAGLAAAGVGAGALRSYEAVAALLRRRLPHVQIPEATLRAFFADFWPRFSDERGRRRVMLFSWVENANALSGAARLADEMEPLERQILTAFLIGSDVFHKPDPYAAPVSWVGVPDACPNPFMRT